MQDGFEKNKRIFIRDNANRMGGAGHEPDRTACVYDIAVFPFDLKNNPVSLVNLEMNSCEFIPETHRGGYLCLLAIRETRADRYVGCKIPDRGFDDDVRSWWGLYIDGFSFDAAGAPRKGE